MSKKITTFKQRALLAEQQSRNLEKAKACRYAEQKTAVASWKIAQALEGQGIDAFRTMPDANGNPVRQSIAFINDSNRNEGFRRFQYRNNAAIPAVRSKRNAQYKNRVEYALFEAFPDYTRYILLTVTIGPNCTVAQLPEYHWEIRETVRKMLRLDIFTEDVEMLFLIHEETFKEEDGVLCNPHVHAICRLKSKSLRSGWNHECWDLELSETLMTRVHSQAIANLDEALGYCFKTDWENIDLLLRHPKQLAEFYQVSGKIRRYALFGKLREIDGDLRRGKYKPCKICVEGGKDKVEWKVQVPAKRLTKSTEPTAPQQQDDYYHNFEDMDEQPPMLGKAALIRYNIFVHRCIWWSKCGKRRVFNIILNPHPRMSFKNICRSLEILRWRDDPSIT